MPLLLKRYASALAIMLIAFGAYAALAVPRIEPRITRRAETAADRAASDATKGPLDKHRKRMAHLFSAGSWQLAEPKVLETEHGTLLFQDYRPLDDGKMELKPLTLILRAGAAAAEKNPSASRPLLLDAPGGAILQFDSATDPARADFGKLIGGRLEGEITITSPPTSASANDGLNITTRNVQLDERRIWTPHDVRFSYGASYGSGSDLVITLLAGERTGKRRGPAVDGVKSLELVHVEKLHLEASGDVLLPGKAAKKLTGDGKTPPAPVEVTCKGPFLFDFVEQVASFEDQVDIIRLNPDGPSDQLNCQLLSIYFKPKDGAKPVPAGDPPKQNLSLDIDRVVAVGHPVVLRAPSVGATARGERLEYHFEKRRIVLIDRDRVMLLDERFDIEAKQIEYELAESGAGLGRLWAEGPGRLRARKIEPAPTKTTPKGPRAPLVPIAARPSATAPVTMEATWHKQLLLRPHEGQQVISLLEQASVSVAPMGGFGADEIHLWLNEVDKKPAKPSAARTPTTSLSSGDKEFEPDRMLALGHVQIGATQFAGNTERLEVWFKNEPVLTGPVVPGATTPAQPAATKSPALNESAAPQTKFRMQGDLVRIQLLRRGAETLLDEVSVEGMVKLWDEPAIGPPQIVIAGDTLQLRGGMDEQAVVHVLGEPATIAAQGMTLRGSNVHLHRGENRVWIEGQGDMQLPLASDLTGQKLAKPTAVTVGWRDGLEFDGLTAAFNGDVQLLTQSQLQWARGDYLEVNLSERLDFAAAKPGVKPDVARIALDGHVALENRSLDPRGRLASIDKLQAENLRIDQPTGKMTAAGPGWVSTIRLGGAEANPLLARGAPPPKTVPVSTPKPQFSYLFVEYQGQIEGNFFQRQVNFQRHVRAIYGPVASWQETLNIEQTLEQLPEQTVLLECQRLDLRQMPGSLSDTTTMEMEATGDTVVEGKGFTARAARIGYQDEKQLLVLEGDGRQDAELTRRARVGGPDSNLKARKIRYWRFDNRVEVDDWRMLDLQQLQDLRPAK